MSTNDRFVTRSGRVAREIADHVLSMQTGQQLPTLAELAARYRVGVGTVQKALDMLRDEGCIEIEAHGQLGTFLRNANLTRLYQLVGSGVVVGVMPLPYSRRYEGLATGIRLAWKAEELPVLLSFHRGAEQRLRALASAHYDFVVMSQFAAETAVSQGWDVSVALEFPAHSYVQGHVVLFAPGRGPEIKSGYRVGVDSGSFDQIALTHHECQGLDVEIVEVGYMQLLEALHADEVQAAIWAADEVSREAPGVTRGPLRAPAATSLAERMTQAVLVTQSSAIATRRLLQHALDPAEVARIQQEVLSGRQMPSY